LTAADVVLARSVSDGQPRAILTAGVPVTEAADQPVPALARELLDSAVGGRVVWVGSPDGDPGLTDALAAEVARRGGGHAAELEVLVGAWDQPGSRLLDVVAVMDRLRSPGGCPWDAEQTHASLVRYALEEAYEVAEAVEDGDRAALREELGDLLLQVVFHARIATEHPTDPFDVDDVAAGIAAKLRRRHPHVFGSPSTGSHGDVSAAEHPPGGSTTDPSGDEVIDAAEVRARWDRLKLAEDGRTSVFDG